MFLKVLRSFNTWSSRREFGRTRELFYILLVMGCVCECVCVGTLSHVQLLVTLWTAAHQIPLSMEFPRQEYWSELPFPPPGDLPDPGIEPASPMSPVLQVDSLPLSHQGNSKHLVLWLLLDTNKINTIDWVNAVAALPYCFSTSLPPPPNFNEI